MAKVIELTRGYCTVVDDDDFEWANRFNWVALVQGEHVYAVRSEMKNRKQRHIRLHREIQRNVSAPRVDHINGNTLDNRRCNLRPATDYQNKLNSRKRRGTSSQFKGVTWSKQAGRWHAYIQAKKVRYHLGYFSSETEAANAYDRAAKSFFGQFARLNFPKEDE